MAKEYIEREALLDDIDKTVLFDVRTKIRNLEIRGANKVINRIKAQPTADVQEVRHGEWIKSNEHINFDNGKVAEWTNFYCSECDAPNTFPTKCCPECGAKMDKEGEQE